MIKSPVVLRTKNDCAIYPTDRLALPRIYFFSKHDNPSDMEQNNGSKFQVTKHLIDCKNIVTCREVRVKKITGSSSDYWIN
jgi:hypothetical protein